ncbi:MAG: hypothetical protein DCE92_04985, partial [Alphaproteobacteria bacterium]
MVKSNRQSGVAFARHSQRPLRQSRCGTTETDGTMFEFGRDLRKIFAQARDSDDLSWLELVGTDLLFQEARQQTTDAGRVSCARPHAAWSRASALWREHARRAGATDSLIKATDAATDAAKHARNADEGARATIDAARVLMLRFDLCGGPEHL